MVPHCSQEDVCTTMVQPVLPHAIVTTEVVEPTAVATSMIEKPPRSYTVGGSGVGTRVPSSRDLESTQFL